MRDLWLSKTSWDEPVTAECERSWHNWDKQLPCLNEITIPRWNSYSPKARFFEVHGFADASKNAFGSAIYLRIGLDDKSITSLQTAKGKTASLKWACTPRLELAAAHLMARLVRSYLSSLHCTPSSVHLWTDSKIVLCWLSKPPSTWETFVAKRCSAIHELVPNACWHHVKSKEDPADIVSRGCTPLS